MPILQHNDSLTINSDGHLAIGGLDAASLAAEFGTPAYIIDEDVIRRNCREYLAAMRTHFGADALPLYAGKALCFARLLRVIASEGLGLDCVSGGELHTAEIAGFPAERIYFHGNNKTDADIAQAISMGAGTIVADSADELERISQIAAARGIRQRTLLRISPGIDTHTHKKVVTGRVDSKFGVAIATGQAIRAVGLGLGLPGLDFAGLHCHIGSQIFEARPYFDTASIMLEFMSEIKREFAAELRELNLGGGLGVRYTDADKLPGYDLGDTAKTDGCYAGIIAALAAHMRGECERLGLSFPAVRLEPGRSIAAAAGITLYTVGGIKEIPGFLNYISVDGGMPDNPRYALYGSRYTVTIANRAAEPKDYRATIAGRCCESGDLIGENMPVQKPRQGDILAVLATGAFNYSMASNYNRIPRPPVIMISGGQARIAVRREGYEDLVRLDVLD